MKITENKTSTGQVISLTMKNIIMFKNMIEPLEKCINMSLNGGTCTVENITTIYNNRSKYVNWLGVGKYKMSDLQNLLSVAKQSL